MSRPLVIIRKWVERAYVQGYRPRVSVFVEVENHSGGGRIRLYDVAPAQARVIDLRGFTIEAPHVLTAEVEGRGLLSYELEFLEPFDGYLEPAHAYVGSYEFKSERPRLRVRIVALLALPQPPLPQPERPEHPGGIFTFEDIPFHERVKSELKSSLEQEMSVLLYGPAGLWKSRLVEAAAHYASRRGLAVARARDSPYPPKAVIAAPDLHLLLMDYDRARMIAEMKRARDSGSIVVASLTGPSHTDPWRHLRDLLGAVPGSDAIVDELKGLFNRVIEVGFPTPDEVREYVRRELRDCLAEDARDLEWLDTYLAGHPKITCNEAESLVKSLKAAFRAKGEKLARRDCIVALSLLPRGGGMGVK